MPQYRSTGQGSFLVQCASLQTYNFPFYFRLGASLLRAI
jgi:hypothetical protein